jgi:hypothetical protein
MGILGATEVNNMSAKKFSLGSSTHRIIGEKSRGWQKEGQVEAIQAVLPTDLAVEDHAIVPKK